MNRKKKKGEIISVQHALENVPDPTNNNLNIKSAPAHYQQKKLIHCMKMFIICRVELPT